VASTGLERFFPASKIIITGNPVRQDLLDMDSKRAAAQEYFNLDSAKKTVLVLGGSLGARRINELIAEHVALLKKDTQIIWQCGSLYFEKYKHFAQDGVQVHAFINKMDLAYSAANFVISRAGAGSISELCIVGKPVIFIPSPHVAEDHQTKNAHVVVAQDAAIMIKEADLASFSAQWIALLSDTQLQKKLAVNIKRLALPKATTTIVDHIEKLLHG
jgi:UDP-N-acetylglucosamine--N-acetylmuramyl-(pentapeptide) pyrophosphoryl-undecaprenol N-acetylglucosamine transferase